jgi:uncharacterized membrane protein YdbT with pleckstrin-like domain
MNNMIDGDAFLGRLRLGEKILWRGKPELAPFLIPHSLVTLPFGLPFMGFTFVAAKDGVPFLFLLPFFLAGFFISFGNLITGFISHRNTEYVITDQRIMVQTGAFRVDSRILNLDRIQEVSVNVGLFDARCGTGTVYIQASEGPFLGTRLRSLKDSHQVEELISEAVTKLPPRSGFTGGQF